jgi:YD repeat-containing protein
MNKNNVLLSAAFLLLGVICHGQGQRLGGASADSKMTGSPSASQGMGSLYSPNLYDGSANINIPIYQYSVENNDFGISFSYNTKGVKVDEISSDVGLHFNINAGANISRVQKDLPDEINLIDGDTFVYMRNGLLTTVPIPGHTPPPDDTVSLNPYWAFKGKYATYFESPASLADELIYRDKEADDFVVSLGSGTFTFNLGKNGTIFTHPHRGISVEVLWNGLPMGNIGDQQPIGAGNGTNLLGFRIRDEQGNSYVFIQSEYTHKTIEDPFGKTFPLSQYTSTSRWVVSEVTLANGGKIKYNYNQLNFNGIILPLNKAYSFVEGFTYPNPPGENIIPSPNYTMKLQSIVYPNDVIANFFYDSRPRADYPYGALREIKVSSPQQCLGYVFKQSFFYADPVTPEKTYEAGLTASAHYERDKKARLKLNTIMLNSCDSTVQEPYYSFGYSPVNLPERLDPRQDFFGYYNGGTFVPPTYGVTSTIPQHQPWFATFDNPNIIDPPFGMNRNPDVSNMKAGILTEVKNAYKGTATFHYGAHTNISHVLGGLPSDPLYFGKDAADGLRLDSIVEQEPYHAENKKVTIFQYLYGQHFMAGGYFHYIDLLKGTDGTATEPYKFIITGSYLTSHQLVNGSNHGYSQVNVITRTGDGLLLSRKEIKFSNFKDDYPGSEPKYQKVGSHVDFYTFPYTDKQYLRDWEMGLPLEVTEYDQNNRIVQKTINKYKCTLDTTSAIGKVDNQKAGLQPVSMWRMPGIPRVPLNKEVSDFYHPYTGAALLDSTIVRKYLSDNAFIADTVHYKYDGRNNLASVYTRNSKGQRTLTTQAYNYTLSNPLGSPLQIMTQAGLEKLVGTERWILGSGTTENKLIDAYFNTFEYQNGRLKPKYLYNFQHGSPLTYSQYTGYTGGTSFPEPFANVPLAFSGSNIPYFVKTSEVTLADLRGNPQETRMLGQNLYKSMIWDTISGQKMAEANARYTDIAYTGFEATVKGNWEYNQAAVSNLSDALAGNKGYFMQTGGPISRSGLTAGKAYIVAFWANNYSTMPSCTIGSSAITLTPGPSQGYWTYYEGRFTAPSSASVLSIVSTANIYLDELRLFPADAGMQSWSYKGMYGLSAETSVNGRVTYYEYDKLGRQTIVRDQDRNILSKTEYHIAQ